MASENKQTTKKVVNPTEETKAAEVKDPMISLKESELNQKLQAAYNRGRVSMLADIKTDITQYFDDTLLSYVPR